VVEREVGDGGQSGKERCEEGCENRSRDGLGEKTEDGNGHESGQQDGGHRNTPREGIAETTNSVVEEPPLTRPSRKTRRGKVR
jgi:hypothetical protein